VAVPQDLLIRFMQDFMSLWLIRISFNNHTPRLLGINNLSSWNRKRVGFSSGATEIGDPHLHPTVAKLQGIRQEESYRRWQCAAQKVKPMRVI
jgi:hypothetical protein